MRKTGEKPMRTPALVATALPPLKPAKNWEGVSKDC